jgi:hypothetical protein
VAYLLSYQYLPDDSSKTLKSINVAQRLQFAVDSANAPLVAAEASLFAKDFDAFVGFSTLGPTVFPTVSPYLSNALSNEFEVSAITGGQAGIADNYHQTSKATVVLPLPPPGCPECVHMHWRWSIPDVIGSAVISPQSLPDILKWGNGQPLIPSGSKQSVDVGVVRYRAGEEHPNADYSTLLNGESLIGQPTVFWYSATGVQPSDTFFMHGGFFSPPIPPPIGFIDTPANHSGNLSGAINFTGWALSPITVQTISLWREPINNEVPTGNGLIFLGNAPQVPGARPDVAATHPGYPNNNYGWGAQILTNQLPGTNGLALGNGTYKLHAIATDVEGASSDLGTVTITVNNGSSKLPFGTIDTPGPGQTISGTGFAQFGWVLTAQPNIVPMDASTIAVVIDGVAVGHPVYNQFRSDIATLFPGYRNTNGAVGAFILDTTKLSNGRHNIAWGVIDSAGNTQGIGSRDFFVQN